MRAENFVYWLQGYFEINEANSGNKEITPEQTEVIKRHLDMVFAHDIDPKMGDAKHQEKLNNIHNPPVNIPKMPGSVGYKGDNEHNTILRC